VTRRLILKEASRSRILISAGRFLRRRGIARSSVQDIMRASRLTVGAFYAHFDSKDDLLLTAIREGGGEMWRRELEASRDLPPAARREALVDAYLSCQHRDHPDGGCMLPAAVAEIAFAKPAYRKALANAVEGLGRGVDALCEPGRADEVSGQALAIIALMYGGLSLARGLGRTRLSDDLLAACRRAARALLP
jgi:TetR/AcrR family transcriptional regulator, transcriptional repressor for nem operon